jgi:vitamin B12 transporter
VNTFHSLAHLSRRFFILIAPCAALAFARAQSTSAPMAQVAALSLDKFVVSASRTPQDPRYTASAVSIVPLEQVKLAQLPTLGSVLAQEPGAIVYNNGGFGSLGTVLMRGANAHQTLFIVDGVRMNDRSSTFQNFLGGADLAGIDRIEVLRGPQSTLYGSSAMGGVVLIDTERGAGPTSGSVSATAGSFETYGAGASAKGAHGALSFSGSASYFETDNDRPQNGYERTAYSARLDYNATAALVVGATFRGQDSEYNEPGSRLFPYPGLVEFSNYLTSVYGEVKLGEAFTSRLTLGSHVRDYVFNDAFGSYPLKNVREILDWQNTWDATDRVQVVAGANFENSRFTVSGTRSTDRVAAGYVSTTVRVLDSLVLTGGFRHDDFKSVGGATTGRGGFAWLPVRGTKVRATFGTGFAAPGSDDVYGVPSYNQLPSPGLRPEKSRGWDFGIDQEFADGKATASVTYFRNEFRNLFEYETVDFTTYAGRTVNRAKASSEGVEFALTAQIGERITTRGSYTYLEAHNDISGARLIRRPRHTGDLEVTAQATPQWILGAGAHLVFDRLDSAGPIENYTSARLFTSYAIRSDLILKLRAENALDEAYEEVFGYPALSRGIFGSVEWRF